MIRRLKIRGLVSLLVAFVALPVFAASVPAEGCRIASVRWQGERDADIDAQVQQLVGKPCAAWDEKRARLVRDYENSGFLAASLSGSVDSAGILSIAFNRGSAWVWAAPENLDSGATKPEVFRRLAGIEEGENVSLLDLERSERKLARLGYYEKTAPVRLFRDPSRNRIVPAYSMRRARVSEAEGVLTYSSEENVWEGRLDVELYNILGTARDLRLEGFTGETSRHLDAYYKEPWIFGSAWNVVLRGNLDEEQVEESEDSTVVERTVTGEVGITRDIGFDFSLGVYLGMSEDDKHSTFEMSYVSLDRFVLPRRGWRLQSSLTWKMDRPDTLENYLRAVAGATAFYPLYGNFIVRFAGQAGGIFPAGAALRRTDLFALGGMDSFKGMEYRFVRSRAYGFSEMAVLWQDGYDLSIEAFYQPGLYRRLDPGHGWAREQDYGIAFTQYRGSWSVNLYYALRNGENYLDGVIGFGLKSLF